MSAVSSDVDWLLTHLMARHLFTVRNEEDPSFRDSWEVVAVLHGGDIIAESLPTHPRRCRLFSASALAVDVQMRWERDWLDSIIEGRPALHEERDGVVERARRNFELLYSRGLA